MSDELIEQLKRENRIYGEVLLQITEIVGDGDNRNEPLAERVRGWVQAAGVEASERRAAHAEIARLRPALRALLAQVEGLPVKASAANR